MSKLQEGDIAQYGQDYAYFRLKLKELSGIDLADYKDQQMHRRLDAFRRRKGLPDFFAYGMLIQRDPTKLREILDFLTINVSEFFRNPEHWGTLREKVLPEIIKALPGHAGVNAWSAGCSGGHEPYSLALVLMDAYPERHHRILATDIDRKSLEKARTGRYTDSELTGVPADMKDRFFIRVGDLWEVSPAVKSLVSFRHHDLLREEYPTGFDLVICRNVIIYFKDQGKERVLRGLSSSLRPGGFLFTGATEAIFSPGAYGLKQEYPLFYRRMPDDPGASGSSKGLKHRGG